MSVPTQRRRGRRPAWLVPLTLAPTLAASLAAAAWCQGVGAPRASLAPVPVAQDDEPAPSTFDASDELAQHFEEARHVAEKKNRRVLVVWGRNGDPDSEALAAATRSRELSRFLLYEYRVVKVHVTEDGPGRALAGRLGVELSDVLPVLTVHDPAGETLATSPGAAWLEDDRVKTAELKTFLEGHQAEPQDAEEVLKAELAAAKKADQRLIVHLGAPW